MKGKSRSLFFEELKSHLEKTVSHKKQSLLDAESEEYQKLEAERKAREDREPLTPDRWIENEYFCGTLARDFYAKLKDPFVEIFTGDYFEILMAGAIGWGKTTFAEALHAYALYLLSCYGVPQHAFRGMLETASMLCMNMNVTETKAKNAYFKSFGELIKTIPYFQNEFAPQKGVVNELRFNAKRILCTFSGATKNAAESENLIFVVLDEINLYDKVDKSKRSEEGEAYDEAEIVHASAMRRMQSRYMLPDGRMPKPCKMICLCKETYPDSFMRKRIRLAREREWDKQGKVYIMEFAEWETKPTKFYMDEWFWIKTGSRTESPKIIEVEAAAKEEARELEKLKASKAPADELFEILKVPLAGGEYLETARLGLADFIRDVCGRPTDALSMFFGDREPIFEAVRKPGKVYDPEQCSHPFTSETTTLEDGARLMQGHLARLVKEQFSDGEIIEAHMPIVNQNMPRFCHIDLGLTKDSAGFVVGHLGGWKNVLRLSEGGHTEYEKAPILYYDLMLRINPPQGGEIKFEAIRALIYSMTRLGFRFEKITLDSFQSRDFIQALQAKGYSAELLSVDLAMEPYINLRRAFIERRVSMYEYPIVQHELVALELINTGQIVRGRVREKVDHPKGGSKDVSDAMAGVADSIEEFAAARLQTVRMPVRESSHHKIRNKDKERYEAFQNNDFEKMQEMDEQDEEW